MARVAGCDVGAPRLGDFVGRFGLLRPGFRRRFGVSANPEKLLLQAAVGGERLGVHDAVDPPIEHDGDALRNRGGDADVLFNQKDGRFAGARQGLQKLFDLGDDRRRQAFGRFVHHQQRRIAEQRAADRQHLLFAAGKLGAAVAAPLGETRKCLVDAFDRPACLATAVLAQPQMLVNRQARPAAPTLRDIGDAESVNLVRREAGDFSPEHADRTAGRRFQPDNGVAQRGLAHAVAPNHRENAGVEGQDDALQGVAFAVVDMQVADVERRRGGVTHAGLRGRSPAPADRFRFPRARLP